MNLNGIPPNSSLYDIIDQKDELIKLLTSMNGDLTQMITVLSAEITKVNNTVNTNLSYISTQYDISNLMVKCNKILDEKRILEDCLDSKESKLNDLQEEYDILEQKYTSLMEEETEIFSEDSDGSIEDSTELEKLKLENKELKKKFICRVCYINDLDITLNACGHVLICKQCLERLIEINITHELATYCPLCNEVVSSYSPLYLPN